MAAEAGDGGVKDLRSFLDEMEADPGQGVLHIARRVSPVHELSAVVKLLEPRGNPLVVFDDVDGSDLPVLVSLCGTRERIALALGQPVEQCVEWFLERVKHPIASRRVDGGPVKEVTYVGADVDLGVLPIGVHSPLDGGRYITSGCGIVRDPVTGNINTGIYRMMVKDRDRLTVRTALPHDLAKAIQHGERVAEPLDFAVAIGHHPALAIGSQAKNPMAVDAFAVSGALMGQPLEVTRAETVDIDVPARAEIVIEGRLRPDLTEPEGPFGEFTYYYGENVGYVCEVTAITHRRDATFVDLHPTHNEHRCLWIFPGREGRLLERLRATVPGVRAVHIPLHGGGMSAYVALETSHDGDSRRALLHTLASDDYLKHVFVVDADVDIFDDRHVLWALNVRFQGDVDMIAIPNSRDVTDNPSSYSPASRAVPGNLTTKVGFDATMPVGVPFRTRADLLPDAYAHIDVDDYLPADGLPPALIDTFPSEK